MKSSIFFCLAIILQSFFSYPVYADTMTNQQYQLQINNSDSEDQQVAPESTSLGTDQTNSYSILSGFPGTVVSDMFSFSIDTSQINYGTLSVGSPVVRTNTLTIHQGRNAGFAVFASENHELQSASKQIIPDTTCDNGQCTPYFFDSWDSSLTYGFGYRCDSKETNGCISGFNQTLYREFANLEKNKTPEVVMKSMSNTSQAQITYKVNISGTQQKATYANTITYVAVPMY